ncbi:MAG: hypothetical protein V2A73_14410, partial [Pseudomonadota bacterium]
VRRRRRNWPALTDELRERYLVPVEGTDTVPGLFTLLARMAGDKRLLLQPPGTNLVPWRSLESKPDGEFLARSIRRLADTCSSLWGVKPEILFGELVPRKVIALTVPRPMVVVDTSIAARPEAERAFLLGRAFDSLRGGYASIARFGNEQQALVELVSLFRSLRSDGCAHQGPATRRASGWLAGVSEEDFARYHDRLADGAAGWIRSSLLASSRAGLLACDDLDASLAAIAWSSVENASNCQPALATDEGVGRGTLENEGIRQRRDRLMAGELATEDFGIVDRLALASVLPDGLELVLYYLSEEYDRLRAAVQTRARDQ